MKEVYEQIKDTLSEISGQKAQLVSAVCSLEAALDELKKCCKNKDHQGVEDATKKVNRANKKVESQAKALAATRTDSAERKYVMDLIDDINEFVPKELISAKALVSNPNDSESREKLDDTDHRIRQDLAFLREPEACLANSIKRVELGLNKLVLVAKKGNEKKVKEVYPQVDKDSAKLVVIAKEESAKQADPLRRQEMLDAIAKLQHHLPLAEEASKKVSKSPQAASLQEELDRIEDKIKEALAELLSSNAPFIATARREEYELDKMLEAVKKGDKKAADEFARTVPKIHSMLITQVMVVALCCIDGRMTG